MAQVTTDDVTIAVCTYGDDSWRHLAEGRALPSAREQGVPVIHVHADTLRDSRNAALDQIATSHVIYLDADDELETLYVRWLVETGTADLRAPAVRYVRSGPGGGNVYARMPRVSGHEHDCTGDCLPYGNWLVIGTLAPVQLLRDAGGWHEWPCFEDWDLWARCWQRGCTVEGIPRAIYRAHVRPDSRNRAGTVHVRNEVHRDIARDLGLPVPA